MIWEDRTVSILIILFVIPPPPWLLAFSNSAWFLPRFSETCNDDRDMLLKIHASWCTLGLLQALRLLWHRIGEVDLWIKSNSKCFLFVYKIQSSTTVQALCGNVRESFRWTASLMYKQEKLQELTAFQNADKPCSERGRKDYSKLTTLSKKRHF